MLNEEMLLKELAVDENALYSIIVEDANVVGGDFDGFVLKPGMVVFHGRNAKDLSRDIVAISSMLETNGFYKFFIVEDKELDYIWVSAGEAEYFEVVLEDRARLLNALNFEKKVREVMDIPVGERANLCGEIILTDVVAGNKCRNGGEYGFYTHLVPTDILGVFQTYTSTTCDFDSCGTTEGELEKEYIVLTKEDLYKLVEESDKKVAEGSLY